MPGLTAKQARFVEEYLVDLNATQAAIRAGYSPRTAGEIGRQLLEKSWVAQAVREAQEALSKRTMVSQEDVVRELTKVAFALASDTSESELKYSGKLKALELLGKYFGLFTEHVHITGEVVTIVDDL